MRQEDAFDAMVRRYKGLLYTVCSRYSRRGVDVDDLLQDATIALWRASRQILPLPAVQQAALVWKISRNAAIDACRKNKETESLPEGYDTASEASNQLRELYEHIENLDEPDRTIVKMQLEGYSYDEIGKQLEMTQKNVSVRLVRAKEKLRKMMI